MKKTIKGQISIFMALIFMVIFTLFTMTVSLSMFIHDKINLQNATDLASYYVASKQAELLGAIAHNNYAIRQSYKLMAYRYRVYGNAGRTNLTLPTGEAIQHPGNNVNWQSFRNDRTPYIPSTLYNTRPSRICIGSAHLLREITGDNQCRSIDFNVGFLIPVGSIVGGLVGGINGGVDAINQQIADACEEVAYINWYYANSIVGAHKYEQRDRRAIIDALARNLARPIDSSDGGMRDIAGGNVYIGARKTFGYNLTESNRETLEEAGLGDSVLTILNSMQGLDPSSWLSPIYTNVSIPYSHYILGGGCNETLRYHTDISVNSMTRPNVVSLRAAIDPTGNMAFFGGYPPTLADEKEAITIGVEKNPWVMVYNKTEASAFSRPLFLGSFIAPEGIRISGMAYSKPFGGRIGPWYYNQWPSGSDESVGSDSEKTDPLLTNRVTYPGEYGTITNYDDPTLFPNYSRFPTDQNGLTTNEAMVQAGPVVGWSFTSVGSGFEPPTSIQDYYFATHSYHTEDYNDPLAQNARIVETNPAERTNSFNRRMEIAAIMPDAFDMTYYSISPNYYDYFIEDEANGIPKLKSWLETELPTDVELRGDIGSHELQRNFSIIDQMFSYNSDSHDENVPPTGDGDTPFIRDSFVVQRNREPVPYLYTPNPLAMLTGWNKGSSPMEFLSPTEGSMNNFFATCLVPLQDLDPTKPRQASHCLRGGRFGYSVKLISGDYVRSEEHEIGGAGLTGPIVNPL